MVEVSQTEQYLAGAYTEQVLHAIRHRDVIEDVLAKHRTKKSEPAAESEQEAAALADSVADEDDAPTSTGSLARFPYKPYCRSCGRDTVEVTSYDDETTDLAYTCACGDSHVTNVATQPEGKLVWKVDWPMRWAYEGVDFEPGGLDHSTPGSSYTVGKEVVKRVLRLPRALLRRLRLRRLRRHAEDVLVPPAGCPRPPTRCASSRRRSCAGSTPAASPKQAFDIDFGPEVVRLYDEWDALNRKAANPDKRDAQVLAYERAVSTAAAGTLPRPKVVVPFRLLSSVRRRHRGLGGADQPHRRRRRPRPRLGRGPRAAAGAGDDVDVGVRPRRGPHHRPRDQGLRAARLAHRGRGALAASAARPTARPAGARRDDRPDLRRAEAGARDGSRRRADRRGQGRPEGVLRPALRAARRRRARAAACPRSSWRSARTRCAPC